MTERTYATIKHPTVEALVHGLYKYVDRQQAIARLEGIRSNFVMSKDSQATDAQNPSALFWIKGYGLNEAELTAGFTGHFCRMEIATNAKGQFTLSATKVEVPLEKHPQKKRVAAKHPNWGHPVMRSIKKGKVYPTLDAAANELELLHLEYPQVSIPGVNKLYLIIYEKREGIKQPTRKIALELTARDAGFIIVCKDNEKTSKVPASKQPPAAIGSASTPTSQKETIKPVGGFSAQELLRKNKRAMKRKKSDPLVSKRMTENPHDQ